MRLKVSVRPSSGRQEIKKISDENYKVFLKKGAEDNKANEELVKFLGKEFGKNVRIVRGFTSKNKVIEYE